MQKEKLFNYIRNHPATEGRLLRLSFGCEVKVRDFDDKRKKVRGRYVRELIARGVPSHDILLPSNTAFGDERMTSQKDGEFEIIGHPPQLNDVLAVLRQQSKPNEWDNDENTFTDITGEVHSYGRGEYERKALWVIRNTPLTPPSEWSEEVCEQLCNLLRI